MDNFEHIRKQRGNEATAAQRRAADPRQSVWVEASAGTGKTKVLSDRVLRLLLNEVNPMRLLCLTYTKAAAVEMSSRISKRLSEWAVEENEKLEKNLRDLLGDEIGDETSLKQYMQKARTLFAKLLDTPGGVKIQTIHSFCTDVLKRFPLEAGVSPYFEVLEDEEAKSALAQIKSEILLKSNHTANSDLSAAIDYFTENMKETTFPELLKNLTDNRRKMMEIIEKYRGLNNLINKLAEKLEININDTEASIKAEYMANLGTKIAEMQANIQAWLHGTDSTDKPKAEICQTVINHNFAAEDYDMYKACFYTTSGELRKPASMATKNAKEADAELVNRLFSEQERLQKFEIKLKKFRLYQSTKAAFTIVCDIDERYEKYKRTKSCMDFADLIHKTRELLQNSSARQWVLYKLDGGIDHILLDEAQDTSSEQWDIVAGLCDDFFSGESNQQQQRTIFVVGDRKQSIFSFQGADPDKFDAMSRLFERKAKNSGNKFERVNLEVSFRSAPAILETVNKIFAEDAAANGVLPEGEKMAHLPIRVGEFGKVAILPIVENDKAVAAEIQQYWEPSMERITKTSADTQMAREIAGRIKQMVKARKNSANPLHYRDFMVLVRTRNNFVTEFIRACEQENVAISGADKMLLSEEIAVQDLISLGKFLLFPQDSLSLAEVLTSPLFSINEKQLEDLCFGRKKGEELWDRLRIRNDAFCRTVYNDLKTLLDNLDHVRPYELYNFVLANMCGRRKFVERMGQEVEDALDEFINMTIAYEQRNIPSLRGFISWFGQSEKEIKRESDEQETDAVRLLTVHHSKGLQAPIVFLPDTSKTPTNKKSQRCLNAADMTYYPLNAAGYDDICTAIQENNRNKEMQEYRRLLYVALTRAEDELYVCAYGNQNAEAWYDLCKTALAGDVEDKTAEIVYETPEYVTKERKNKVWQVQQEFAQQSWMDENITTKEENLSKPYRPSHDDENETEQPDSISPLKNNGQYYRRGTLIHRLLQFLPAKAINKEAVLTEYLQKNANDFSDEAKKQITKEVLNLLNNQEFTDIFGEDSRAEVPVVGEVEGKIISAQIDRLIVLPDRIKIVDFKTNQPPAKDVEHTPRQYIKQLEVYAELMQKIYPLKPVETYILWTNETRLMRVA